MCLIGAYLVPNCCQFGVSLVHNWCLTGQHIICAYVVPFFFFLNQYCNIFLLLKFKIVNDVKNFTTVDYRLLHITTGYYRLVSVTNGYFKLLQVTKC